MPEFPPITVSETTTTAITETWRCVADCSTASSWAQTAAEHVSTFRPEPIIVAVVLAAAVVIIAVLSRRLRKR